MLNLYMSAFQNVRFSEAQNEAYSWVYHILRMKQNKMRPMLLLHAYNLFGDEIEDALPAAFAMELFYTCSVVHDEVEKNDFPSVGFLSKENSLDTNTAIISGDILMILSYKYLAQLSSPYLATILQMYNEIVISVFKGQFLSKERTNAIQSSAQFMDMVAAKYASLTGFSMRLGALVADAKPKELDQMQLLGSKLGVFNYLKKELKFIFDTVDFQHKVHSSLKNSFIYLKARELAKSNEKDQLNFYEQKEDGTVIDFDMVQLLQNLNLKIIVEEILTDLMEEVQTIIEDITINNERKESFLSYVEAMNE